MIRGLFPLLLASQAQALDCFAQTDLFDTLTVQYGEAPQMQGLTGSGGLMQLWAGEAGTWTLLLVTPQGQACVLGVGGDFMDARQRPKPDL